MGGGGPGRLVVGEGGRKGELSNQMTDLKAEGEEPAGKVQRHDRQRETHVGTNVNSLRLGKRPSKLHTRLFMFVRK